VNVIVNVVVDVDVVVRRAAGRAVSGRGGIHWHAGCRKGSDSGGKYAALLGSLQEVLAGAQRCRARHAPPPRNRQQEAAEEGAEAEAEASLQGAGAAPSSSSSASSLSAGSRGHLRNRFPLLIWRETLPQHFPSSNGGYPLNQRFVGRQQIRSLFIVLMHNACSVMWDLCLYAMCTRDAVCSVTLCDSVCVIFCDVVCVIPCDDV
jgi:hypothetical protein